MELGRYLCQQCWKTQVYNWKICLNVKCCSPGHSSDSPGLQSTRQVSWTISNSLREVKYTFSLSRTTISLGQVEYLFKIIHQCNWRLHFDNDDLCEIQCMTSSLYRYQRTIKLWSYIWFSPIFIFSYIVDLVNCRGGIPLECYCPRLDLDIPVNVLL